MSRAVQTEERVAVDGEVTAEPRAKRSRGLAKPEPREKAGEELFYIFDAISTQLGPDQAALAAREFRAAAVEGRINGLTYGTEGASREACVACAIGTLGRALGYANPAESFSVKYRTLRTLPGWHTGHYARYGLTPIEDWVLSVTPGETAQTNAALQTVVSWIDQWSQSRGVPLEA